MIIADPRLARQVFLTGPDTLSALQPDYGRLLVGLNYPPKHGGRITVRRRD